MTAKPFAPEFLAFDSVSPVAGSGLGTLLNLLLLGIPTGLLVLALLWGQQGMGWVAVLLLLGLAGWWGRPFWIRVGRSLWHQVRTWPGSLWMVLALSLALIGGISLSGVFARVGSLSWEAI
ncbi:MAG: pentapeptide repeat-containing protein, partial [Cyanobacteriota bacterium]